MVETHGEVWMVLFQLMADQGVSGAVQGSLESLVHWNVSTLDDANHLGEHMVGEGSEATTAALPGGMLAATAPEESSMSMGEGSDGDECDGQNKPGA